MSYRCHFCQKTQPTKTPVTMVVLKTRNKLYPEVRKGRTVVVPASSGKEIVNEVQACPTCATPK